MVYYVIHLENFMHPLINAFCNEITKDTILTPKTGGNGFIILNDGRIFELIEKYSHDKVACMLLWNNVKDKLIKDSVDILTAGCLVLTKYSVDLPVIRLSECREHSTCIRYYSIWFTDEGITNASYNAFRSICKNIYGVSGCEEVTGPRIDTPIETINTYTAYMKHAKDGIVYSNNYNAVGRK